MFKLTLLTALFIATSCFALRPVGTPRRDREVAFYMTPWVGSGNETLQWLKDGAALASPTEATPKPIANTVYYCCGLFQISNAGLLSTGFSDARFKELVQPLAEHNISSHMTMSITPSAVLNITWNSTHPALVTLAKAAVKHQFRGVIVDYEPSSDYTAHHEKCYASFLTALSAAMHKEGKQAGFCSAGWGILYAWQFYRTTGVDTVTSMNYKWLGDGSEQRNFVSSETAPGTGMPLASVSAGMGTTLSSGYKPEWNYNWTEGTLLNFTRWLKAPEGGNISKIAFWRADGDHGWPAKATQPWVFEAAKRFLWG